MKYVVVECHGDGISQKIPIIFPNQFSHVDAAEALKLLFKKTYPDNAVEPSVVSAGSITWGGVKCAGSSSTLSVSALEEDSVMINYYDYFMGLT